MSLGTLLIACLPGYETIGLLAPSLVVLGRHLQGFSAGVELGGVSIYLSEIATPGRKGFYVPFLVVIRQSLKETDEFLARKHRPTASEIIRSVAAHWPVVLIGTMMATMTTVAFYIITAYTPTFGQAVLHLASSDNLMVTLCVGVSNFFWLPVMGALSDKVGRRPLLLACASLALVTAYPAMSWLVGAPSFSRLLTVELWLSFIYTGYNGALVVFLTEIMPSEVRTAGFSLAYSLATALGGFTPAVSTSLIHLTGNRAIPGMWLSLAAACGLVAAFLAGRQHDAVRAAHASGSLAALRPSVPSFETWSAVPPSRDATF